MTVEIAVEVGVGEWETVTVFDGVAVWDGGIITGVTVILGVIVTVGTTGVAVGGGTMSHAAIATNRMPTSASAFVLDEIILQNRFLLIVLLYNIYERVILVTGVTLSVTTRVSDVPYRLNETAAIRTLPDQRAEPPPLRQ